MAKQLGSCCIWRWPVFCMSASQVDSPTGDGWDVLGFLTGLFKSSSDLFETGLVDGVCLLEKIEDQGDRGDGDGKWAAEMTRTL